MKIKRVLAVLLTFVLLFGLLSAIGCSNPGEESRQSEEGDKESQGESQQSGDEFGWLHTDGTLPIVEAGVTKTLKVAIMMYPDSGEPSTQWFYQFIEKAMNIQLEVEKFTSSNARERLSMMFADGDLPDIIIGGGFGTADLMTYGAQEGMLEDLAPYISEKMTPNLYKLFNEHPEYKSAVADADGHIWSLGYINDTSDRGQVSRAFLNYDWMEEAGLSTPTTLEEFVDVLRAYKNRGSDIIPLGGTWNNNNPCLILLNAFGYLTEDPQGFGISLRNGKTVLPVADREVYGEYLKLLHQLYEEGLLDKNFFTRDDASARALMATGKVGYMSVAPFVLTTDYEEWWGAKPLTSQYNSTAQWPSGNAALTCGGFVLSANSENKELAMAFADWFFEETGVNYNMSTNGPSANQTDFIYNEKVTGFTVDSETFVVSWPDYEYNTSDYSSKNDYLGKEVYLWGSRILGLGLGSVNRNLDAVQYGYTADQIIDTYPDVSNPAVQGEYRTQVNGGEMHFRSALDDTVVPYVVDGYPGKVYLEAETATRLANLMTIIKEFATQETAKFVTGKTEINEETLNDYFNKIEKLGALEVIETYSDYYESLK